MGKAPHPVTREHALQLIELEKFTACQQLKRYTAEYNRKVNANQKGPYTDRLEKYIEIFKELCEEATPKKPLDISEEL